MLPTLIPAAALALAPHPLDKAPEGLTLHAGIAVAGSADGPGWLIEFRLTANLALLRIPAPLAHGPADGLWQHTCLEAFVQQGDGPGYREFNFSPSGQWAVYRFDTERQRSPDDKPPWPGPALDVEQTLDTLRLLAWIPMALLPERPAAVGLTAVIETRDGRVSHWALHHPRADRPDFHHAAGWTHHPALPPLPTAAPTA